MDSKFWYQSTIALVGSMVALASIAFGLDKATSKDITTALIALVNAGAAAYIVWARLARKNPPIN